MSISPPPLGFLGESGQFITVVVMDLVGIICNQALGCLSISSTNSYFSVCCSFVNTYTATVGRMTRRISVVSTKAYDPKRTTSIWNFRIPSTSRTRSANQQTPNIAANLNFLFFSFILTIWHIPPRWPLPAKCDYPSCKYTDKGDYFQLPIKSECIIFITSFLLNNGMSIT